MLSTHRTRRDRASSSAAAREPDGATHPDEAVRFVCVVHAKGVLGLVAFGEDKVARVLPECISCAGMEISDHLLLGDRRKGCDVPRSGWIGYWTYIAAPVTKDQIVTRNYAHMSSTSTLHRQDHWQANELKLTPHSEKHSTVLPSGAHSALTRPSEPASIFALHSSSLNLYTHTTPVFAHAPRTYSESHDQPACVIHAPPSPCLSRREDVPAFDSAAAVGEGEVSTSQVRAIWNESERRMIRRFSTAVSRKWVPGLNETSKEVCLYISVKSIALCGR